MFYNIFLFCFKGYSETLNENKNSFLWLLILKFQIILRYIGNFSRFRVYFLEKRSLNYLLLFRRFCQNLVHATCFQDFGFLLTKRCLSQRQLVNMKFLVHGIYPGV